MSKWDNNNVQYPRLLSEINAVLSFEDRIAVAESMDITLDELETLFDRAEADFIKIKNNL